MRNINTDFTLPHDVVKLPSEGKFYKNGKKSVKVGYLTAADENILMGSRNEDLIPTLLRAKLYETDISPNDMINGDIRAILLFLRASSFGNEYKIQAIDPGTGKDFETTITVDPATLRTVKTDVAPDENGVFSTTLPKSKMEVQLRPLTFGELMEIEDNERRYPTQLVAPVVTWRLQKYIVSLNGKSDQGYINEEIEKLPIMDSKYIKEFLRKNEPRLDLSVNILTPSGKNLNTQIEFGPEFFRPFF